jgi:hypothetical protein
MKLLKLYEAAASHSPPTYEDVGGALMYNLGSWDTGLGCSPSQKCGWCDVTDFGRDEA